jgi:hypothetical protein
MYEINYSVQKKKQENSKYALMNNEQDSQLFIFEIILKTLEDKSITIRKIKKGTQGMLISSEDNIKYSDIDRIKISILDSNNLKNKYTILQKLSYLTFSGIDETFTKQISEYFKTNYLKTEKNEKE